MPTIPNTFGITAHCPRLIHYSSVDELLSLDLTEPLLHIGAGSNLLFLNDYPGLVIHSRIRFIEHLTADTLRVGAGMTWDDLVSYTLQHGLYGLENLSLIPGEVGASAVQNIGAYGVEAKDFITEVTCIELRTGRLRVFRNEDCHYAYRQSVFKTPELRGRYAVLDVTYRLSTTFRPRLEYGGLRHILAGKTPTPELLRQTIIDIRRQKLPDPAELGNAGSFFMNPIVPRTHFDALVAHYPDMPHYLLPDGRVKIPAGWMIEQCGWKGRALGPAAVHDRQALILVNRGGATGQDILRLCQAIQNDVNARFGIMLHPEVNFI